VSVVFHMTAMTITLYRI